MICCCALSILFSMANSAFALSMSCKCRETIPSLRDGGGLLCNWSLRYGTMAIKFGITYVCLKIYAMGDTPNKFVPFTFCPLKLSDITYVTVNPVHFIVPFRNYSLHYEH